ncbi:MULTISPECIES: glutathione S-transferase family protein [unclassified Mesorhizobium]|uniref:glutathione S-transferase family protein n=1 Tax=unclassified Mesorhizobium TaxID=325217 RepID=UPI000BAFB4DB|nr:MULTISPECIES: glutathione S-transferase family protein [unclassified Mesorhizobium]TGT57428.1 glutathione S-transferase family protein [Mesorhizobium sp. M00.F.Ca.ET.170.01.1.1]PBB86329.1 glutathione S-transferase [Mesorhizobium sp. WSM3876]RWB73122.1 MAG: glutathione S-transferase family protein [Mesorhizobium sp.]RWB82739.1 MAG: glutathione S-transferase family protein [Mesorhizobium sp.]RWE23053.1 MAG: glutathione S-transferase family protein [Mesorhizobium sp.]
MKLLFSRNPNPRLAVAVARHLEAKIAFEFAAPMAPGQTEHYRALNPNLTIPILAGPGWSLWEADAIACRLSRDARSDFWRSGDDEPDMIRWLSWGKENFVRACDMVHFERGTKQRYRLGPIDQALVEEGLRRFHTAAALLDTALSQQVWLVGETVSYADFRMATLLPFNSVARLPLDDYPSVSRWYRRLEAIDAWRDPFGGLEAPELPPVRSAAEPD